MADDDGYQIDGSKDAREYYWTGAPKERRAYSRAYANAKLGDRYYDDKNYLKNVAAGGRNYDAARAGDDADYQMASQGWKDDAKKKTSKRKPARKR